MPQTIVFTGFPGFLGTELLPRVLARAEDATAACLIQAQHAPLARTRVAELTAAEPALQGRIELVEGDITLPDLGLGERYEQLAASTSEVFHLAAVYDLAVPREVARKVNVTGTAHVLDFAQAAPGLERVQYVSTCYVSGKYPGPFRETDLSKGQRFNNHYEETKHAAEVLVQERMRDGLPATIYRPAVVSGDSATGATQKLDGPYFVLRWILRQPKVAVMPMAGDPSSYRFNFVPRDFVVDAISELSARADTANTVYALADPDPLTVSELLALFAELTDKRLITVPLTTRIAKGAIAHVPGVERLMQIPPEAVDYFTHPTHYLTDHTTAALADTDIQLPDKREWCQRLVAFTRENLAMTSAAMV